MDLKLSAIGPGKRQLVQTHNNLGNALYRAGRYEEAKANYAAGLEILAALGMAEHAQAAGLHYMIGMLHSTEGAFKEGAASYEICISMRTRLLGAGHHGVAASCRNVAEVYKMGGQLDLAVDACRRSLQSTLQSSLGRRSPHLSPAVKACVAALDDLGRLRCEQCNSGQAAECFSEALSLCKEFGLGQDDEHEALVASIKARQLAALDVSSSPGRSCASDFPEHPDECGESVTCDQSMHKPSGTSACTRSSQNKGTIASTSRDMSAQNKKKRKGRA